MHCGSIRQTASIISMSKDCLRTGDKALIHFRFIKHPEYMTAGQRMVFREGRTKAVGNVVRIITQTSPSHQNNRTKQNKQQPRYMQQQQQQQQPKLNGLEGHETINVDVNGCDTPLENSTDKRDVVQKANGPKKGRSRRGGRGKTNNNNSNGPLNDMANINAVPSQPRNSTKVQ